MEVHAWKLGCKMFTWSDPVKGKRKGRVGKKWKSNHDGHPDWKETRAGVVINQYCLEYYLFHYYQYCPGVTMTALHCCFSQSLATGSFRKDTLGKMTLNWYRPQKLTAGDPSSGCVPADDFGGISAGSSEHHTSVYQHLLSSTGLRNGMYVSYFTCLYKCLLCS